MIVVMVILVVASFGPTLFGLGLALHLHVSTLAHLGALGPTLVAVVLTRAIRERSDAHAKPMPGLVVACAALGLVASASLVFAWCHLVVATVRAAMDARLALDILLPVFALAQGHLAVIFFGELVQGVGARSRSLLLPTADAEILALADALGASAISFAYDASSACGPDASLILGVGLVGAIDAGHLAPLAAFARLRRRHGKHLVWRRVDAALREASWRQERHELVFTPLSPWFWMVPASHRLLRAAIDREDDAAERLALTEMRARDRSSIDAALAAQIGAARALFARAHGAAHDDRNPYRATIEPTRRVPAMSREHVMRLTGLSAWTCDAITHDRDPAPTPAVAAALLEPYERAFASALRRAR